MIAIVEKDGVYINRVVTESLDIVRGIYGSEYSVSEETIDSSQLNLHVGEVYIPLQYFCPVCKKVISDEDAICDNCGTLLE